jgi:hypothetical protein
MAVAGMALSALGTAVGVVGQMQQAKAQASAQASAAAYNAQVAENQKATQIQLAQAELAKGAAERERVVRTGLRAQGEIRSLMGASGFAMDSASNLDLLAESASEAQYDVNIENQNTAMAAWQRMAGAVSAENDANFARWQGSQANAGSSGAWLGAAGTLLGGIGSGLTMYSNYSRTQIPTNTTYVGGGGGGMAASRSLMVP